MSSEDWQVRAEKKRAAIREAIPSQWRLANIPDPKEMPNSISYVESALSEEERRITSLELEPLAAALAERKLSARTVTEAFAHRAAIAHQLVCIDTYPDKLFKRVYAGSCAPAS